MRSSLIFRIFKNNQIFVIKQFSGEDRIIIGSGPAAHISLPEISLIHCVIEKRGNEYFVCDLGSESGTYKNGLQVLDEMLLNGESIEVGLYNIVFFIGVQNSIIGATKPESKQNIISAPSQQTPQPDKMVVQPKLQQRIKLKPELARIVPEVNPLVTTKKDLSKIASPKKSSFVGSQVSDLKDYLKPGLGPRVEILVAWKERVLETYHYSSKRKSPVRFFFDVELPSGTAGKGWNILNFNSGVLINIPDECSLEVVNSEESITINENQHQLQQGEICFLQLNNDIQIIIRFSPKSPIIVFDSSAMLGPSEITGMLAALIVALLTSLLVSVYKPKPVKDEIAKERLAEIVFMPPEPPPLQKVQLEDKKSSEAPTQVQVKEKPNAPSIVETKLPDVRPKSPDESGKASEIKPKETKQNVKMFTSVKHGGSLKTGGVSGANTKSKEVDLKNSGLLAAFGSGGARAKLDKAYSGSGQLIGDSEKANGNSGFNSDRQGEDLGFKTKDTGAGGSGTATQGISGINTKGRGGGQGLYGSGTGLGEKGDVTIAAGGGGESFTGSIDKEAVRRVVRSALAQFKACYEREYRKNTKLSGKVVVRWDIDEKGTAKNARIVREESTINNSSVEECVKLRMLGLKFPETPVGTYAEVSYPFLFEGPKL